MRPTVLATLILMPCFAMACAGGGTAVELPADARQRFQGDWLLRSMDDKPLGTLQIDGDRFVADSAHGYYEGVVTIRPETSPAQIDFAIDECRDCGREGKTSTGIYYEDDVGIVFAGPETGDPRPKDFETTNQLWRMRRETEADGGGEGG